MKRFNLFLLLIVVICYYSCSGPEIIQQRSDLMSLAMSAVDSGNHLYRRGCYRQSINYFFRAHELFASSDTLTGTAMCLNNIGNVYNALGDTKNALLFYDESYQTYLVIKDQRGTVQALTNKAAALIDNDQLSEANNILIFAQNIAQNAKFSFPPLLTKKGILLTKQQNFHEAEKLLKFALEKTDPNNLSEYASINFALGNLKVKTNHHVDALSFFQKALIADREACFHKGIAEDLASIGDIQVFLKKNKDAISHYKRSIMVYALINNDEKLFLTKKKLEAVARKEGVDLSITKIFTEKWKTAQSENPSCY